LVFAPLDRFRSGDPTGEHLTPFPSTAGSFWIRARRGSYGTGSWGTRAYPKASTLVSLCYHLLCCSTPRSETHLPPRCSRASVYRSTCAGRRWADYRIRWTGTLRWAPTLVSARATRLNNGRSSAQHVDHLTQNRRCLPPTHVAFEHLATAVVAGHLMGRVRGLRHRQRLQHIIRPLQVEQAETSVALRELRTG